MASLFEHAKETFFARNQTKFLSESFQSLLTTYIPQIISSHASHGSTTTLLGGSLYSFSITDVCVHNSGITVSDCFKHCLTNGVPIVGTMTLSVTPLLADPKTCKPEILSQVRTVVYHQPIPTGASMLTCALSQDQHILNQSIPDGIFITDGKMKSISGVKSMSVNMPLLQSKKKVWRCQVRSSHEGNRTITEGNPFRSTSSIEFEVPKKKLKREVVEGIITCKLPFSKHEVHIGVLAQAFGCEPQRFVNLIQAITGQDYDAAIFRPYEISILYHQDVLNIQKEASETGKPLQEVAICALASLSGKELKNEGINLLKTEIFSHLSIGFKKNDRRELYFSKLFYLAMVISLQIQFVAGKLPETSRDLWRYAVMQSGSALIGTLIRTRFLKHVGGFVKILRRNIMRRLKLPPEKQTHLNLAEVWAEHRLTHHIKSAIHSGKFSKTKSGVSIPLNDNNQDAILTQLLRSTSSMSTTDSVNVTPRKVQQDGYGYIGAAETPEGKQVGLVTEQASTSTITTDVEDPRSLAELLQMLLSDYLLDMFLVLQRDEQDSSSVSPETPVSAATSSADDPSMANVREAAAPSESVELLRSLDFSKMQKDWYLYINHCGVPTHFVRAQDVQALVKTFREKRRNGVIYKHCSISVSHKPRHIRILCEAGLLSRPLIVLDRIRRANPKMSFYDMVDAGIIEWVTPAEEQSVCKVAVCLDDVKYAVTKGEHKQITHLELTQASFVGCLAGSVVFLTGQQGPRLALYWHQKKQSMTAEPKIYRGSIMSSQTFYPHMDLIYTEMAKMVHGAKDGRKTPCMLALVADPRTQEDSIKFHKQALQRGLGLGATSRNYTSEIGGSKASIVQKFEKPKDVLSKKNLRYDAIQDDGLPIKRQKIAGGEVVIGKTTQTTRKASSNNTCVTSPKRGSAPPITSRFNVGQKRCISRDVPKNEGGQVIDVVESKIPIGKRVRVEVQVLRPVELGDKFTTDKGQKGVAGEICSSEDMPFEEATGMIPDIIISPIGQVSRMTMATKKEGAIAKAVVIVGDRTDLAMDKQNFSDPEIDRLKVKEAGDILERAGWRRNGATILVNGKTGQRMRTEVFFAPIHYERLMHLASNKLNYAAEGPRDPLTRAPKQGKRRLGGLRFGEGEEAAALAQGAAYLIQSRLRDLSDPFEIFVCSQCQHLCDGNKLTNYAWCTACERRDTVHIVKVPFSFVLHQYELMALGVKIRVGIRPTKPILQLPRAAKRQRIEQIGFPKATVEEIP